MSKYIIEIKPEYEDKFRGVMILGAENSNLYVDSNTVDELEELTSDYVNEHFGELQDEAYKQGLEEGKKATFGLVADASNAEYQKGFEDGKAVNDKGCEGCKYQANKELTCPCSECANNFKNQWTAKDDKIEVGDEVRLCRHKVPYIVTSCDGDDDTYILMTVNGGFIKAEKYNVRKTNRHFDIASILEAMKA